MCKFLLSAVLMMFSVAGFSTEYYSQGNGQANNPSNWNSARNGSGSTPAGFSGDNDVFIIQNGHSLVTNNTWNISGAGSVLRIENSGTLEATHAVSAQRFEILSGGNYIHNYSGQGILGINNYEFQTNSTVEVRNWVSYTTPLPVRDWGNLTVSYQPEADWNQDGNIRNVKGNLRINLDNAIGNFLLSLNNPYTLNVGGNLIIESGGLFLQNAENVSNIHIAGSLLILPAGILNITSTGFLSPIALNINGDIHNQGSINGENIGSLITMTGNPAILAGSGSFNAGLRIASGANVSTVGDIEITDGNILIVAGEMNTGSSEININNSYLVISGGVLRSSGLIYSGITAICTGTGEPNPSSSYGYCSLSGNAGSLILEGGSVFTTPGSSGINVGDNASAGNLIMSEYAIVEISAGQSVNLLPGSVIEMDFGSSIYGNGSFTNQGGKMIIGSPDGISISGAVGNIQTVTRSYSGNASAIYEYRSSELQYTGNGLPAELSGRIIFNNSGNEGIILSSPLTIKPAGVFELQSGIISLEGSNTLTFEQNAVFQGGGPTSFINGAITKIGNNNFIFHVGREEIYSPVTMTEVSGGTESDVYRVAYFPIKATNQFQGMIHPLELDHISENDTWLIEKIQGGVNARKRFTVTYSERSGVDNLSSLTMAYRDGDLYRKLNSEIEGTTSSGTVRFIPLLYGPFTLASTDMMNPLPVVLTDFTAEKSSFKALLKWNVTPDSNPEYFEILHAGADQNYTVLAKLNAGEYQQSYQYFHHSPFKGDNFYQLRITDKQGIVSLSKIQSVSFELEGNSMALYPSYGTASNLMIASSEKAYMKLQIRNQNGQLLNGYDIQLEKGNNNFFIDMIKYPAGVYMISVYEGNKLIDTKRFIKR